MSADATEATTGTASAEDEYDEDAALGAAAAAPTGDTPDWVKEGTTDDEDDIPGQDVTGAKPMEAFGDYVEPATGVLFTIDKAVIETYVPDGRREGDGSTWKNKRMSVWLKVTDGIKYKGEAKPKYKGKVFFHRFYVAVNREAEQARLFDFSRNAQGKPTVFWDKPNKGDEKAGKAWGELNEFLTAMGIATDGSVRNNKSFRDSLVGRQVVYDITKEGKEEYKDGKSTKLKGEFENHLRNGRAAKAAAAKAAAPATVAAAAATETPDWETES